MKEPDFEAFQKRYKKDRILLELSTKEASFPAELAKLTESTVDEIEQLLEELESEKLVEYIVGKYYQLSYEGYKRAKELLASKREW